MFELQNLLVLNYDLRLDTYGLILICYVTRTHRFPANTGVDTTRRDTDTDAEFGSDTALCKRILRIKEGEPVIG